jgi:hypothetical protein
MKIAIVGGGPCGLYLCDALSKTHDVTLYERDDVLGGCWATHRNASGLFSEHAPRVMLDNYVNTIEYFREKGIDFFEKFHKVDFVFYRTLLNLKYFTPWDVTALGLAFVVPSAMLDGYSVKDLCDIIDVSRGARGVIEDMCWATTTSYSKFSAKAFVETLDICLMSNLYEAKENSDTYMIPKLKPDVRMKMGYEFIDANGPNEARFRTPNGTEITEHHDKLILCFPPKHAKKMHYTGIGIQYHYDESIKMKYPDTETIGPWRIIVSYNYKERCVSSVVLNYKEAHKLDKRAMIRETWKQITDVLDLPKYSRATVVDSVYKENGRWKSRLGAFYLNKNNETKHYAHDNYDHVGSHNITSFPFASFESAVISAKEYLNESKLLKRKIRVLKPISLKYYVYGLLVAALAMVLLYFTKGFQC